MHTFCALKVESHIRGTNAISIQVSVSLGS